jgi:hypothetical protein
MHALINFHQMIDMMLFLLVLILQTLDNPDEVTVIRMHALDYEEFLWANNVSNLAIQELRSAFLHERAVSE